MKIPFGPNLDPCGHAWILFLGGKVMGAHKNGVSTILCPFLSTSLAVSKRSFKGIILKSSIKKKHKNPPTFIPLKKFKNTPKNTEFPWIKLI
jgi:hypothetical protein